ncbi:methionyl-tRNA synthetase [Nakamurella panacisegetis]|uniref:Methionine--tRNA ligase n=1 Tax=Nakamurella panacisegetis TaxID=1090615 RepID=A0A1H0IME4_9ACTN|nr:methionine--tRNA ligase [Nakamurella panacisegetis]SDO32516.1 methionyl-tRNA synthetase [Nakamurella panacisegetis]
MSSILTAVAWPYANGPRHIGHVSGFGVPSDVFSRYQRMAGNDVLMVSGTDEHGTPILVQADAEGVPAQALADRYNKVIVGDLQQLGLGYDLFTRTTTRNHYAVVQELFRTVYRNGYMVPKTTMSAISPSTGRTLPDRYIEGTCPICGYGAARGDQCDNCGNQLDPIDLINPKSRINGETPAFVESEHLFLDLPALAQALGDWLNTRNDWRPNVLKFSMNLLADLKPRAMTRDIDWGIPVPLDGWRDRGDKKLYVWFDAVIGYLSASIEWARRFGDSADAWQRFWSDDAARQYYFMGKDNITFHSQIWPAELLGYNGLGANGGEPGRLGKLNLPTEVVSSEFLTMSGSKFSTSRKTVIYVGDFISEFGADALRYFIVAAGPENQDSDFTWDEFVRRNNSELANEWGNLVNRSVSMAHKNFGEIPAAATRTEMDVALLQASTTAFDTVGELLGRSRFKQAMGEAMRVVSLANKYISDTEPWKLGEDRERQATVLNTALQVVDDAKTMLTPFLPHSSQGVFEALGGSGVWAAQPEIVQVTDFDDDVEGVGAPAVRDYPVITGDYRNQLATWERRDIVAGTRLAKPNPLFAKLDPKLGETGPEWAPIS